MTASSPATSDGLTVTVTIPAALVTQYRTELAEARAVLEARRAKAEAEGKPFRADHVEVMRWHSDSYCGNDGTCSICAATEAVGRAALKACGCDVWELALSEKES